MSNGEAVISPSKKNVYQFISGRNFVARQFCQRHLPVPSVQFADSAFGTNLTGQLMPRRARHSSTYA
jgi:hypothetical protein